MKVAVFGGSFDPVHAGHVAMVDHLLQRRLADEIVLVPAGKSPFKTGYAATGDERAAMLELAFAGEPRLTIERGELQRGGVSYTVETLERLAQDRPDALWELVLGLDNLAGFGDWRSPQKILDRAGLIVFSRGRTGSRAPSAGAVEDLLRDRGLVARRVMVVRDFHVPVSSREVRARLQAGQSVSGLIPETVGAFIRQHGLYGANG